MTFPVHRLAELAAIRPGYLTREAVRSDPVGSHRLLQLRDFTADRTAVDFAAVLRFSPDTRGAAHCLREGDVLFLAKGASNFAFALPSLAAPTLATGYFFVLRPTPAVAPAYLAWFLNLRTTRAALSRLSTKGARTPVIRRATLAAVEVPLPPLAIQRSIAVLDSLSREESALLAELAQKRRALVTIACASAARNRGRRGLRPSTVGPQASGAPAPRPAASDRNTP